MNKDIFGIVWYGHLILILIPSASNLTQKEHYDHTTNF